MNDKDQEHIQKTIEFFADDYRNMDFSDGRLKDMLEDFTEALLCEHQCSSNCRREGCNCKCGEYHI
jgi:hypothetical protein